jgi:hypothetical protein
MSDRSSTTDRAEMLPIAGLSRHAMCSGLARCAMPIDSPMRLKTLCPTGLRVRFTGSALSALASP